MWRVIWTLTLLSLFTWLTQVAHASGPGDPFKVSGACWFIILQLGIIILVLIGLLLKEKSKNKGA
jgi:hypothetical protein